MASVESCAKSLSVQAGVAELLVQYIHERPRAGATPVELSACERLQQKAAIAISRLCNSEDVGLIFIELHCKCLSCTYSICIYLFLAKDGRQKCV
jgi:Protein inscuteable C-terminal